ncbi:ArsR/SmtB family transcription factor [Cellulosimicrobium cellulans]|jgi:DNA-binding transcriptional ArsR family regulator|uniref:HTH arsR-type domain-containing protein n=2 Tax=Actinomycetes TaxID=1760 RepID=A0A4Y4DRW5_CELCE|nr:metalloregulator ArsR/SmtB family transcription factor [Cellulosimicrobium cellulans]GED08092.1 hypothetical protein CCE02nite_00910 [Cellulosimicrobium cellulans]
MREDTKGCTFGVESQYVELAAEVFSLLADATRVRIVLALRDTELPVNALAEIVGKSPTAVSQHLAKLRWGRIVRARQEGNRVFYSLVDEHARTLVTQAVFQAQHAVDDHPAHHADDAHGAVDGSSPATEATTSTAADR